LVALTLCTALCAASAAEKITSKISGLPDGAVEGQPFSLTVDYDVAPDLGEVPLHVELKNPRQIVLVNQIAPVQGKGTKSFTFVAPKAADEKEIFFAVWYGQVWTEAIVPIIQTESVLVLSIEDAGKLQAQKQAAEGWRTAMQGKIPEGGAVAVLVDDLPGLDRDLAAKVAERFTAAGLKAINLSADEVSNSGILTKANFHTLALVSPQAYPVEGVRALEKYLGQGGNIIALGAPAFRTPVKKVNGKWMSEEDIRAALAQVKTEKTLLDFETGSAQDWSYGSGPNSPAEREYVAPGPNGAGHALHCVIPRYENWNTFGAPALNQPFDPGQELTCLWAKGSAATGKLAIEWVEKDGSRWIATINLTPEWKYYVLTPYEFAYWQDNPSKGRGGTGDHFKPENADKLTVGIAQTHTPMDVGPKEFWVGPIGVAKNIFGANVQPGQFDITPIDGLTPEYKFFSVTNAADLRVSDKQCLLPQGKLPVPAGLMSVQPRPQGTGYNKDRKWRFIPLIEAFDKQGEVCGTPACMIINRTGRFANSIITSFTLPPAACATPQVLDLTVAAVKRMRSDAFLFEGGAEFYGYFDDQPMTLGARSIDLTRSRMYAANVNAMLLAKFQVSDGSKVLFNQVRPLRDGQAECQWKPGHYAANDYQVTCTLTNGVGQVLDVLSHPVTIWRPAAKPDFMRVQNGQFMLHGKPWKAHGVNFMPSSGIGIEDGEYFELWIDKQAYDPVVIERDLDLIKAMGMNMVSVFCYYQSLGSHNLIDCLERCRRHGIMVNLSLRPGTPMDFRWEEMKALIEAFRLAQNDTVFAYDLAWEPSWGNGNDRRRWNPDWAKWIVERYGSVENAEADWGVPAPRENGAVVAPPDNLLQKDGPHRVMVCAYRRFLDDLLEKKHSIANGLIKSIDPNHFTSFRMSIGGDPTIDPAWIGYDFRGLARSVDIMEPEGYGRIGDWDRVKPGRFTADYARCMAPGRPVMWAEFGYSPYGKEAWNMPPAWQDRVGKFYDLFYKMVDESAANGTVSWWWPGGVRYGENSDYGDINPDGSWRPVSRTISQWAPKIEAAAAPKPVDEWITIDRDATVKGIIGVYDTVKDRYFALIDQGKNPGLRTDGYGLDSATAPRRAVGNTPYKPGLNPHKYLNAEIDRIEVKGPGGRWQAVGDEGLKAAAGQKLQLRVTVGNIGEAKWLARDGRGQVSLQCGNAKEALKTDVPFMGTAVIEFTLTLEAGDLTFEMHADPDVVFGEKVTVKVGG
jgi:hypothetical protein